MSLISPAVLSLRRDPRILKLPPYLSALCILIGTVWLLLLPLDEYSRHTYISENALLPGQVHTYFGGSEENIFRAYRHEIEALADNSTADVVGKISDIFKTQGLKVATQDYEYVSSEQHHKGQNVYGLLQAPRGDATEAIVLVAAWRNMDDVLNQSGVALVLNLARYFKRWSLWSKDIIFLITSDSRAGPQAWVDAYHDQHSTDLIDSLSLKSGALQGALVIDQPSSQRFETVHVVYDGINGQLPNLDLINTAVSVASGQLGIGSAVQNIWKHDDSYPSRLRTMFRGMFNQGLGHAAGPHSSFMPYHIDAITLQAVGDGWQDEMAMGRVVEGVFRSLNNLLEHFHQSFFFYLLMHTSRFVSIGTYLPSAMLVAGNFTIMAIALWIESGRPPKSNIASTGPKKKEAADEQIETVEKDGMLSVVSLQSLSIMERHMSLPLSIVIGTHALGLLPLYVFNHSTASNITPTFFIFAGINILLPYLFAAAVNRFFPPTKQDLILIKCFSLLLLGMCLSALATVNFSLAFLIGLFAAPLTFTSPLSFERRKYAPAVGILFSSISPSALLLFSCWFYNVSVGKVLIEAAFGWDVWGMWTPVVVWCVWWPAWLLGGFRLASVASVTDRDNVYAETIKKDQ